MTKKDKPKNSEVSHRPQDNNKTESEFPECISPEQMNLFAMRTKLTSGPLPHPDILQGYEKIQEGFADRVIRMAEEEVAHRHKMEERELEANIEISRNYMALVASEKKTGQYLGFGVAIACIGCGTWIALAGHPVAGTCLSGTSIAGLVSAFIYGRSAKEAETKQHPPSDSEKEDSKNP